MLQIDAGAIAAALPGKVSDREVESALRLLTQAKVVTADPESGSLARVRLLATPDRIKRELGPSRAMELDLLRALWRMSGDALNDGVTVDMNGLPPGFNGAIGTPPLLDRLQDTQFLEWQRLGGGDRLTNPKRPLSAYPIDWNALERRRKAELAKLESVQQYAYASGCRRGFVLRYFGDPAAGRDCGGCDNCLGTHAARASTATRARAPLKPGEKKRARGAAGTQRSAAPADTELVASPEDARVLERLRTLRTSIARDEKVPAYVVFSDRTLLEIAVRRPKSVFALGEVRGVGPAKIDKYGQRFLDLLSEIDETEAA
jgi:ATP-dependent DNA helicase RecQ